jgi:hypothetical protein
MILVIPLLIAASLPKFMGNDVTITKPPLDSSGMFPEGPATVCVETKPQRQCYTAPGDFGKDPTVSVVQLDEETSALFFSAAGGGVSGFPIHYALLRLGKGKDLDNILLSEADTSNQSQHGFLTDPTISNAKIFATADYAYGPSESHYSPHRFTISVYVRRTSDLIDESCYYLEDRYMTVRKYDYEKANILAAEKQEILTRLRRVKAETK